jgi:pseudouridine-5'-phosphate glycosidase
MMHSTNFLTNKYLRLAPEVRDALASGRPVIALESTVIAHGLPRPTNLNVAREMEAAIRAEGAVPAPDELMDRSIVVGLSEAELERLATTDEPVAKASRRGLAVALAQ